MSRNREKQAVYQKRYMNRHRMLSVLLDKEDDVDIISWLETQENRSEAVRRALQDEILKSKLTDCNEDDLKAIIFRYKEEVKRAGSEHRREDAMRRAFLLILEMVEAEDVK